MAPAPNAPPGWSAAAGLYAGVGDPFYARWMPQLSVRRAVGPVALEVVGARAFSWASPGWVQCSGAGACVAGSSESTRKLPGDLTWVLGGGLVSPPIHGKVNVSNSDSVAFIVELSLAAMAVRYGWEDAGRHEAWSPGVRWSLAVATRAMAALEGRVVVSGLCYPTSVRQDPVWLYQWLVGLELVLPGRDP